MVGALQRRGLAGVFEGAFKLDDDLEQGVPKEEFLNTSSLSQEFLDHDSTRVSESTQMSTMMQVAQASKSHWYAGKSVFSKCHS